MTNEQAPAAPAGWYETETGRRYWDGSSWSATEAAQSAPAQPPGSRPSRRLILALAGAAVVVAIVVIAIVATNVNAASAEDRRLTDAVAACGLDDRQTVTVIDDGQTVILDGEGTENPYGISIEDTACVLGILDVPSSTLARMDSTRALDGQQTDTFGNFTVDWTYHPDDGLDIILTHDR